VITVFLVTNSADDFEERPNRGSLWLLTLPFVILLLLLVFELVVR